MASHERVPDELELIRSFINTLDIEHGEDALSDPQATRAFLVEHDLIRPQDELDERDVAVAREVREALRALLFHNHGDELDPQAIEVLNRAPADLVVRFDPDGGARLEPRCSGVERALASMFSIVLAAMADGTWSRLKACRNDECAWAYYDHSKNRSSKWCSMETCGSRVKARAYRERKAAKGSG